MSLTISAVAHTAIDQMFTALDGILEKAAAHAAASGVEESVYLDWRLAPDMFCLAQQVRVASEIPARTMARLAGAEPPDYGDQETTFEELRARIVKARADIKALSNDAIDANPDGPVSFPVGGGNEMTLPRRAFLQNMILPNLYFHVSMSYAILRRIGVDLGKMDFLAAPRR